MHIFSKSKLFSLIKKRGNNNLAKKHKQHLVYLKGESVLCVSYQENSKTRENGVKIEIEIETANIYKQLHIEMRFMSSTCINKELCALIARAIYI